MIFKIINVHKFTNPQLDVYVCYLVAIGYYSVTKIDHSWKRYVSGVNKTFEQINKTWNRSGAASKYIVCPGSSDPFYIVSYYIKWILLPGHTV